MKKSQRQKGVYTTSAVRLVASAKSEKIENKKKTTRKLHEGFQKWSVKRKLEYENASRENEPPTKRGKRSTKVSKVFFPLSIESFVLLSSMS